MVRHIVSFALVFCFMAGLPRLAAENVFFAADKPLFVPAARGRYAVLIETATFRQPGWRKAADLLVEKHAAALVVVPDGRLEAAVPTLRRLRPAYACVVLHPEAADRDKITRIHRMMRRLDDDPYADCLWGILTGYDATDAQRLAAYDTPLAVGSGFSSMGPGLAKSLGSGFASSEVDAGKFWTVRDGRETLETVSPDPTRCLAEEFSKNGPQLVQTSGHATEKDWQVGYTVRAGQFRCDKGQLYALGTDGKRYDIYSPQPKICMPVGNCLIGHVSERDCMLTAWIHTGVAYQFFGYTAVTFFGYMGWGVNTYFNNGGLSLAQAFHANGHALMHQLSTRYPAVANLRIDDYDSRRISRTAQDLAVGNRDVFGMLWDRDAVAFYGDPAWVARMPVKKRPWEAAFEAGEDGGYALTVTSVASGNWPNRPLVVPLPVRLSGIRIVDQNLKDQSAVVTDDFVLFPVAGTFAAGTIVRVRFSAQLQAEVFTGKQPVIRLDQQSAAVKAALAVVDAGQREPLREALLNAGENSRELARAVNESPVGRTAPMAFLISNMPDRDLYSVGADFLLEHVKVACDAWDEAPWSGTAGRELFLDAVLPYACLDERRELSIADMRQRCLPLIAGIENPGEAGLMLNRKLFDVLRVQYHATQRPKPNQSPGESIAAGFASCSGLSILLVDACRSVGVPARVVGVSRWSHSDGNHTWVEIWDGGKWEPVGAAESHKLGDVWFRDAAAKANPGHRFTRIYAGTWDRHASAFPLAWDLGTTDVFGKNVTAAYQPGKARDSK